MRTATCVGFGRGLVGAFALALSACDALAPQPPYSPPPSYREPQTRVLALTITPDTVAVGDTALIHVAIRDSTDQRFRFRWNLGDGVLPVDGRLDGPRIRFVAPRTSSVPGEVFPAGAGVTISNGSRDSVEVHHSFVIPVRN